MRKHSIRILTAVFIAVLILSLSSFTAIAITDSDVQAKIAASGREAVSGNVFIWFLCAVAFLKVSQKIDSFMSSLGVNVGHTGGNMMAELMVAARGVSMGKGLFGGGGSGFSSRGGNGSSGANGGSGTNGTSGANGANGGGNGGGGAAGFMSGGLIGVAGRKVQSGAAASATGSPKGGVFGGIGGKVFQSSLNKGGDFANNIISSVAHGNISQMGSITGDTAACALQSYMNVGGSSNNVNSAADVDGDNISVQQSENSEAQPIPSSPVMAPVTNDISASPAGSESDVVFETSGSRDATMPSDISSIPTTPVTAAESNVPTSTVTAAESSVPISPVTATGSNVPTSSVTATESGITASPVTASDSSIPARTVESAPVQYSDVEIGGGRISGYETAQSGEDPRQFAMYSTAQYMAPEGHYDTVTAIDDSKWYKQYAQAAVERTPYQAPDGSVKYNEAIVQKMPPMPRRKDRV